MCGRVFLSCRLTAHCSHSPDASWPAFATAAMCATVSRSDELPEAIRAIGACGLRNSGQGKGIVYHRCFSEHARKKVLVSLGL